MHAARFFPMPDRFIAIVTSLLIAAILFALDAFVMPLGIAAGTTYVAAVLFSMSSPKRVDIVWIAALCVALSILGSTLSPAEEGTQHWYTIANRCLAIFVIVATALVGWSRKSFENRLSDLNQTLSVRADASEQRVELSQIELSRVSLDLDESKMVQAKHREMIARYRSLIEALPLNVFQKDLDGRLRFGNSRYFETLGMKPEDVIGKTDADLFPAALAEKYHADDLQVVKNGRTIETIEEHLRSDGQKLYVQVFKAPVFDEQGKIVGSQGMFWDVTARILAEQSQQQSDVRFRRLVKSNILGIIWSRHDGLVLDANQAYLNMVGYSIDDVVHGRLNWNDITPPEFAEVDKQIIETTRRESFCQPVEKEYMHRDGHRVPVLLGTAQLEGEECICFILDISKQKQHEAELQRAKELADAANRSKGLFLANMSHEVRTPLNAIIGMTEMVLDSRLEHQQAVYLKTVLDSGESLLAIINDVLDFSKLEAHKLKLEPEPFRLRERLSETMKSLAVRAHSKGLELVFDFAGEVPDRLIGDVGRLRQVLTNLVGNAIKFTDKGEVVVSAAVAADPAEIDQADLPDDRQGTDSVLLHFSITDTGIGITESERQIIFDAFEQADNSSTRKFGGTGLGLAICKSFVELMQGRIWVDSEWGQGSTFHFTARLKLAPESANETTRAFPAGGRVLICDDNSASAECLAEMVRRWDLQPTIVHSSADGLREVSHALQSDCAFEIALIDTRLPDGCGFELQQNIAELHQQQGHEVAAMMMLNSQTSTVDVPRCKQENLIPYLMKPIAPSDLFDAISTRLAALDGTASAVSTDQAIDHADDEIQLPRLRVLLAEDSVVNQQLVLGILAKHNQEIVVCGNGRETVEAFREQAPFDVILMDIQMPQLDGLEATRLIREHEAVHGGHVPIIAMTAHAMSGDRQRCLDAGMDEYISKPIRLRRFLELFATVTGDQQFFSMNIGKKLPPEQVKDDEFELSGAAFSDPVGDGKDANMSDALAGGREAMHPSNTDQSGSVAFGKEVENIARESHAAEPAEENDASASASKKALIDVPPHVDWEQALSAVNGDKHLLAHLVDAFNEEAPRLLNEMRSALEANSAVELRRNAHTLKGSMRLFAANIAYELAYALETLPGEIDAQAEINLENLDKEVQAVLHELTVLCSD
jgi:PAS domain S-box-containing protein